MRGVALGQALWVVDRIVDHVIFRRCSHHRLEFKDEVGLDDAVADEADDSCDLDDDLVGRVVLEVI